MVLTYNRCCAHVRFGTEKYNMAALDRACSHLTNTSLNKLSPGYNQEKDRVGAGDQFIDLTLLIFFIT